LIRPTGGRDFFLRSGWKRQITLNRLNEFWRRTQRSVPAQDPSKKSLGRCRIAADPIVLDLQRQYQEYVMSSYVDLAITPVPAARLADYRRLAEISAQVWREHGALSYIEVEADDAKPGKVTSFPQSVALEAGETVIVAMITYRSRAHRDEVGSRAMKDPRIAGMDPKILAPKTLPFDAKRMFFGGFKSFIGDAGPTAIQTYLFFRGRCEEAIAYYKAEVLMMLRFKDNPDKPGPDKVPAALDDKIMHASLRINGAEIMMSDGMHSGDLDFQCMSLSLSVSNAAEAERIFNALAADGTVEMPLGKTFFSPCFGAVADKFGVSWMVIVQPGA
jgi:PhnB protein